MLDAYMDTGDSPDMGKNAVVPQYNWASAFVAYANGQTLDDISVTLAIPMAHLERRCREDNWLALSARLQREVPMIADDTKAQLEVMRQNRAKNYKIACDLRDDLVDVVKRLRETKGDGMILKLWHNKGSLVEREVPFGPQDRVALATYAKLVADLTYRALGDKDAAEGGGQTPSDAQGAAPSITIILPGVISKPRNVMESQDLQPGLTLDLSKDKVTVTETPTEMTPQELESARLSMGG